MCIRDSPRSHIECWLTDMDGVLVRENRAIPGAAELIAHWTETEQPYLVLTNNSIFTARDLSARLAASGLHVPEERIWTSALATAAFLKQQKPGGTAFVIGEAGAVSYTHLDVYKRQPTGAVRPTSTKRVTASGFSAIASASTSTS